MLNLIRERLLVASLLALVALAPQAVIAQSGSAGGSIGNDEKSVSGSRQVPAAERPAAPARRSRPQADEQRASRGSGGGGGNFDGAWVVTSVGCGGSVTGAMVVSSGRIIAQGVTGRISPNGSVSTVGQGGEGGGFTSAGRFAGSNGSGTFRRADGCTGTWTASKQ